MTKRILTIVLSPLLLVMGVITTLVLLPFYPLLHGWGKADGNQSVSYPFLRFLRTTITMYFK
mgnify:FL=1